MGFRAQPSEFYRVTTKEPDRTANDGNDRSAERDRTTAESLPSLPGA